MISNVLKQEKSHCPNFVAPKKFCFCIIFLVPCVATLCFQHCRYSSWHALEWPAQSHDLNPIETLWHHLKQQLAAYEEEPKSMAELWERVQENWNRIPVSVCINLI